MAKEYTPASRNREAFAAMTDTPGNVPPQAVELEEAVLGALMLEKDSIITVQEFITPEAFYTEEHRTIYRAIEELSTELKPIDLYTVTERLKVRKELQKVGGASYLAQLTQKVGSAANVEFHAKIIAQKYVQRHHSMHGCLNLFFLFIINIYSFRSGGGFVNRLFSLTYFIKRKRICCFF